MSRPRRLLSWFLVALVGSCAACGRAREPGDGAAGRAPESFARPAGGGERAPRPLPSIPADAPRVVFLGDSIAAGLHLDPSEAFPAGVQRLLAAEGVPFRLVNAGVSGDTSAGGLARLDWLLKQRPAVLVLELGGNDGLRGQPVADIEARLRAIVSRTQEAGVRVLLLGVRLPPSLGAEYTQSFEALYPRLAEELGCAYVPFFMQGAAGDGEKMLADGIHPNADGHEILARNVAPALRLLLEELAPAVPGGESQ